MANRFAPENQLSSRAKLVNGPPVNRAHLTSNSRQPKTMPKSSVNEVNWRRKKIGLEAGWPKINPKAQRTQMRVFMFLAHWFSCSIAVSLSLSLSICKLANLWHNCELKSSCWMSLITSSDFVRTEWIRSELNQSIAPICSLEVTYRVQRAN